MPIAGLPSRLTDSSESSLRSTVIAAAPWLFAALVALLALA